jgi:two-component system, OmpR family, phosphate regulon sensor histidine kinase PhoR
MNRRPLHRGAWMLLGAMPAAAALAIWALGWPLWLGITLALAAWGMGAGLYWVVVVRPSEREAAETQEQVSGVWADLAPRAQPPEQADAAESLRRLRVAAAGPNRRAETDLANLRAVLDGAAAPLLATNAAGEVLISNRAAEEFFGRPEGSLTGLSIEELFTQAEVLGLHASALAGRARQGQVRMQAPGVGAPRVYQVLTAPVSLELTSGPGTGVVVSLRDITELSQAVQLKTDFVANASHELRTPLSSIRGAVETLSDGAWEDEAMRTRLTGMISGNVSRLEEMVRDLLDLSRLESAEAPVHAEPVSLGEMASTLSDDFGPALKERGLSLKFEIEHGVERIRTDPRLLELILKNLIDNASKFAYEGTTVRVLVEPWTPGAAPGAQDQQAEPGVRIQVIDRGVGIPISQQQRVFERFFQVDPSRSGFAHRRGTGLGLAIVKHAVKALGGSIGLESVWKQGTTMIIEIPGCLEPQGDVTGA